MVDRTKRPIKPAHIDELLDARLYVPCLVGAATLQNGWPPVPQPGKAKAGMANGQYGILQMRRLPSCSAIASDPSARTQAAPDLTPTSLSSSERGTPVHSEVLVNPCVPWTVFNVGFDHSVSPLPEHSMNMVRDTEGKRI